MNTTALIYKYEPHASVVLASAVPQLSRELAVLGGVQGTQARFDPTSPKYLVTVVALPAALLALGLLSMLFLNLALLLRLCFHSASCYPLRSDPAVKSRRQLGLTSALCLFALGLGLTAYPLLLGNSGLDAGIADTLQQLRSLTRALAPLHADARSLASSSAALTSSLLLARGSCGGPQIDSAAVGPALSALKPPLATLSGLLDALVLQLDTATQYIGIYLGASARGPAVYALAALPVLLALCFCASALLRRSAALKLTLGLAVLYFYLSALAALPVLLATSLLADVCTDPFAKILSVAPQHGRVYNTTFYYSTCLGPSVLGAALGAAADGAATLNATLTAALGPGGPCSGGGGGAGAKDPNLLAMRSSAGAVSATVALAAAQHLPACPALQSAYVGLVDDAACGSLFSGLLLLAVGLLAGGVGAWLCVVLAAELSPHLDPAYYAQVYAGKDDDYDDDDLYSDDDDDDGSARGGDTIKEDDDEDEEEGKGGDGVGGEGGGGRRKKRRVAAELSLAEREGRQTEFDFASLSDALSADKNDDRRERLARIPDEDDEGTADEGGWGGRGDNDDASMGAISVLTGYRPEQGTEEALHGVASTPMGREDDL